ncbi:MAG: SMP-30/gluconolactonase/LRE family protein [Acidobacteriia bacterium]|nr:SMP-30/gluconolactonase/LRE family protein [Terriglobia bacterium]
MSRATRTGLAAAVFVLLVSGQDFSEVKVEQLAKGYSFTEGPAWSNKDGYLVFSDTPGDRLLKWVPGNAVEVFRESAGGPSGNAFDTEGRLYTCETHARRVTRTDRKGAIEVLADKWEGKRFNAPNDIVVSKTGHVYFTDPAFGEQSDHRELDFYGVYHIAPKAPMKLVAKPNGRPNGIALSPNGRILYVVNSDERNIRTYDVDRNGDTSNERVLISGIAGVPGGVRVDEKGNLYVAANGIAIYSPDGKSIHMLEMHGRPSNCGFGEPDLRTLFVTAGGMVYRVRLEARGAY